MLATFLSIALSGAVLSPAPIKLAHTYTVPHPGHFDYMNVDVKYRRIYAAHRGAKQLVVFSYKTGNIQEVTTGEINGVQVSNKLGKLYVTGPDEKLTMIDQKTLKVVKSVKLDGPGDDLVLDTKRDKVYLCIDDGTKDWRIDAKTLKLEKAIKVDEAPEYILYSPKTDLIYQNIKSTDKVQIIDPKKGKVVKEWATGSMKKPHGLAINEKTGHVISVGSNGKLVVFAIKTGKILQTINVKSGVDQIAFDPSTGRVYCAAKGFISVVQDGKKARFIAEVPSPAGSHTICVDPISHDVWVCYGDDSSAHLAQFVQTVK